MAQRSIKTAQQTRVVTALSLNLDFDKKFGDRVELASYGAEAITTR